MPRSSVVRDYDDAHRLRLDLLLRVEAARRRHPLLRRADRAGEGVGRDLRAARPGPRGDQGLPRRHRGLHECHGPAGATGATLLRRRGWLYIVADAPRLALHDFQEAIRLDPSNGDAYNGRGLARLRLGEHREAVADAEKALGLGEPTADLFYKAARVYALAAIVAAAEVRKKGQETVTLVARYQDRAAGLLREAIKRLPADQPRLVREGRHPRRPRLRTLRRRLSSTPDLARAGPVPAAPDADSVPASEIDQPGETTTLTRSSIAIAGTTTCMTIHDDHDFASRSTPAPRLRRRRRRTAPPAVFSGTIFRLRPRVELMEDRTLLSTFLVSNTGDSGPGSLRQAILDSNAATGATNTIDFDIPGSGVQTIVPLSPLPAITNPVLIDGFSQPGYAGTPLIEINGSQAGGGDGLTDHRRRTSPSAAWTSTASARVPASTSRAPAPRATGSMATSSAPIRPARRPSPTTTASRSTAGASDNLIGTNGDGVNDAAERNLISGNVFAGVWIDGQGTDGNVVAGNFIGTNVTGDVALDNGTWRPSTASGFYDNVGGGVIIDSGASDNRIGGDSLGRRRPRPRPRRGGPDLGQRERRHRAFRDRDESGNVVAGDLIGTDHRGNQCPGQRAARSRDRLRGLE